MAATSTSTASGCAGRQCCASANADEEDGNKHSGHRDLLNQLGEQNFNAQQHNRFPPIGGLLLSANMF
jgi:hypothetical protein